MRISEKMLKDCRYHNFAVCDFDPIATQLTVQASLEKSLENMTRHVSCRPTTGQLGEIREIFGEKCDTEVQLVPSGKVSPQTTENHHTIHGKTHELSTESLISSNHRRGRGSILKDKHCVQQTCSTTSSGEACIKLREERWESAFSSSTLL